jgi:integrase
MRRRGSPAPSSARPTAEGAETPPQIPGERKGWDGCQGDAAGLNGDGVEPVGLHDLRHSFVALALDSGVTLAEAAVLARHANAKVTGAIYAGVSEQAKAKIADKLTAAGFGS